MRRLLRSAECLRFAVFLSIVNSLGRPYVHGQPSPQTLPSGPNSQVLKITIRTNPWVIDPSGQQDPSTPTSGRAAIVRDGQSTNQNRQSSVFVANSQGARSQSQQPSDQRSSQQWASGAWIGGRPGIEQNQGQGQPNEPLVPFSLDLRHKDSIPTGPINPLTRSPQQQPSEPNVPSRQSLPEASPPPRQVVSTPRPGPKTTPSPPARPQALPTQPEVNSRTVTQTGQQMPRENMQKLAGPIDIWGAISRLTTTQPTGRIEPTPSANHLSFLEAIRKQQLYRQRYFQSQTGMSSNAQRTQPAPQTEQQQSPWSWQTAANPPNQQPAQQPVVNRPSDQQSSASQPNQQPVQQQPANPLNQLLAQQPFANRPSQYPEQQQFANRPDQQSSASQPNQQPVQQPPANPPNQLLAQQPFANRPDQQSSANQPNQQAAEQPQANQPNQLSAQQPFANRPSQYPEQQQFANNPNQQPVQQQFANRPNQQPVQEQFANRPNQQPVQQFANTPNQQPVQQQFANRPTQQEAQQPMANIPNQQSPQLIGNRLNQQPVQQPFATRPNQQQSQQQASNLPNQQASQQQTSNLPPQQPVQQEPIRQLLQRPGQMPFPGNQMNPFLQGQWPATDMRNSLLGWQMPQMENMNRFQLLQRMFLAQRSRNSMGNPQNPGVNQNPALTNAAANQTAPNGNFGMTTPAPMQPITPSLAERRQLTLMMTRTRLYERNCNQPGAMMNRWGMGLGMAAPSGPSGPEPMACHCYPRSECESVAFMYINPQTTRECNSRVTGYACCCEERRPIR